MLILQLSGIQKHISKKFINNPSRPKKIFIVISGKRA